MKRCNESSTNTSSGSTFTNRQVIQVYHAGYDLLRLERERAKAEERTAVEGLVVAIGVAFLIWFVVAVVLFL